MPSTFVAFSSASAPISTARSAAAVSVVKYGCPCRRPGAGSLPRQRRDGGSRVNASATSGTGPSGSGRTRRAGRRGAPPRSSRSRACPCGRAVAPTSLRGCAPRRRCPAEDDGELDLRRAAATAPATASIAASNSRAAARERSPDSLRRRGADASRRRATRRLRRRRAGEPSDDEVLADRQDRVLEHRADGALRRSIAYSGRGARALKSVSSLPCTIFSRIAGGLSATCCS